MFALANLDRALFSDEADGAGPLEWSEDVWQVAISHSRDMCERNFYDHDNPEGESPSDRADRLGFPELSLAENIHIISDPIVGHYDFMAEPSCVAHRSNILQPRAVQGAVALHYCDLQSNDWTGYSYVTENFNWDFDIDVGWCEIESHVCNEPD